MDVYCSKQAAAPRKRSVTAASREGTAQFCNRLGCCGRLSHTKGTKNKCLEKPSQPFKPSFRSSSGKEVTATSSKSVTSVDKKRSSKVQTIPTESSSVSDESEIQQVNGSGSNARLKSRNTVVNKVVLMPISKTTEVASSSTRIRKVYTEKCNVSQGRSSVSSAAPQITDMDNSEERKYGLRSLRCPPISDVYRQGDTNSESNNGRRSTVKKRFTQGESSSSGKGKRVSGVSANEGRASVSTSSTSISDPRHSRNWTACRASGVSSVRTQRSMNMDPSTGPINRLRGDNLSLVQSTNVNPGLSQTEILWPSAETSLTDSNVDGGHSTSDTASTMITNHPVVRFMNHNGAQHYNMEGIADVLLALDRIEKDEELTYEQLVSLEANLFLGGLNLYDQHRDMRLDIDNMSYEELLVLEEKMGTVSTALSEEELSKCIRISEYECVQCGDESRCSICQEVFVRGDEIGRVGCGHGYHSPCINQWLRLKNWCPICKASSK